ncbi:MBL fold metallo-hydrolase [Candidatus Woesearchaeota archaeon]|nr:MBL fold metallo-hydrolase [Candidatus Woesearchaeota archaeon]
MAEVNVLIKGYTSADSANESGEERTQCTISLIRDKGIVMVVDPGTMKDRKILIDALKKEGIGIGDVNYVCITHSHMDHYRNIGMFPDAKALDFFGVWEKDTVDDWNPHFSENIKIIKTPGHDRTCITLFVKTKKGIIAVAGDVFWKENEPKDDPYADSREKLEESRKLVLGKADFIVPGHGDIYEVKK